MENRQTMEYNNLTHVVQGDSAEFSVDTQAASFLRTTNPIIFRLRRKGVCRNYNTGAGPSSKKTQKSNAPDRKYVSSKPVAQLFASKQAREEIAKNSKTKPHPIVYDEIRSAIESHSLESQDKVPTRLARKWMDATCEKWKADINLSFSIIKNVMFPPKIDDSTEAKGPGGEDDK